MARPQKDNLEYFSHDVTMRNDKKIKAVRARFGLDGYAIYCMLLEAISEESGLQLKYTDFNVDVLACDFGIDRNRLSEIITYFSHPELNLVQIVDGYIVCEQLESRHSHVFLKRGKSVDGIRSKISAPETGVSGAETSVSVAESTHRIEENRIEENKINTYALTFEKFWNEYPKKKSKGDAEKAWIKIKSPVETLNKILTALEWQKKSKDWVKEQGQYIPYPATYIRASGWNDESGAQQSPFNKDEFKQRAIKILSGEK